MRREVSVLSALINSCVRQKKSLTEGVVQIVRNWKVRGGGQSTWDSTKEQNIHATAQKTPQNT